MARIKVVPPAPPAEPARTREGTPPELQAENTVWPAGHPHGASSAFSGDQGFAQEHGGVAAGYGHGSASSISGAAVHGAAGRCAEHAMCQPYQLYGACDDSPAACVSRRYHRDDAAVDVAEAGSAWSGVLHAPHDVYKARAWFGGRDRDYNSGDDGYNSADEVEGSCGAAGGGTDSSKDMDEDKLEQILNKEKGFRINRMQEDGNCLFRAISDQIYGDPGMHQEVRKLCMDYLLAERSHFSQFVTQDFDNYVERKRHDRIFGNNLEMQAIAELFNRPIEVYRDSPHPMKIFHDGYTECDSTPLRLSYHRGNHYNSVVNPKEHTVGEGLGIPLPQPGAISPRADKIEEQFQKMAMRESEEEEMEAAILESMLRDSRIAWERTQIQAQLEHEIMRESRHDFLQSFSQGSSARARSSAGNADFCAAGGRPCS